MALAFVRVMVAVYLARGRNWARIVVAVLVCVSIVAAGSPPVPGLPAAVGADLVVDLVVLWLLFNARSSRLHRGAIGGAVGLRAPDDPGMTRAGE